MINDPGGSRKGDVEMKMKINLADAIMDKVYMHIIDRQTEKLRSLIGDEEMDKFIEEVSIEALNVYCDAVGGRAEELRSFGHNNLEGILTGKIGYSDFMDAQENEHSEMGS
jgi:hypothetical protein